MKKLRKKFHLSQKEVADMLGIDRVTYITYEKGRVDIPYQKVVMMARMYGVTLEYMIGTMLHGGEDLLDPGERTQRYPFDTLSRRELHYLTMLRLLVAMGEEDRLEEYMHAIISNNVRRKPYTNRTAKALADVARESAARAAELEAQVGLTPAGSAAPDGPAAPDGEDDA